MQLCDAQLLGGGDIGGMTHATCAKSQPAPNPLYGAALALVAVRLNCLTTAADWVQPRIRFRRLLLASLANKTAWATIGARLAPPAWVTTVDWIFEGARYVAVTASNAAGGGWDINGTGHLLGDKVIIAPEEGAQEWNDRFAA